jgi:hypothetical protein
LTVFAYSIQEKNSRIENVYPITYQVINLNSHQY